MPAPSRRPAWALAAEHLAASDPVMESLHTRHGPPRLNRGPAASERFESLASSIAYQQLNGTAAATIWGRVLGAVGSPFTPDRVVGAGPDALRAAGLSGAKTAALLDLSERVIRGEVSLERIGRLDDDAVIDHLTVVRGIGPWTAQMFLMFDLRRIDVWPVGDYGVRAGLARAHGWDEIPSEAAMRDLGEPYAPYRSVVAWWCWREVDSRTPA